jgi:hypothetical protein
MTRPLRRASRPGRLVIETNDGRRFIVQRLGGGWICGPPGAELDHNAVIPSLRDAIALATGIGPEAPWVAEQVRRVIEAGM